MSRLHAHHPAAPLLALLAGAVLPLAILAPEDAEAQVVRSHATGLMVAGHISGASLNLEDADRSAGAGVGGSVAWGFASGLGVFAQVDRSDIDVRNQPDAPGKWGLWNLDAGLRYHFRNPERTVVPFVQGSFTVNDVTVTEVGDIGGTPVNEMTLRGYGGAVGGGAQLHITPGVAFRFAVLIGLATLNEGQIDGVDFDGFDIGMQSTRLNIGLGWWPGA